MVYQFNFHWHGLWRSGLDRWDVLALVMDVAKNILLLSSSFVEVRSIIIATLLCLWVQTRIHYRDYALTCTVPEGRAPDVLLPRDHFRRL